MLTLWQKQCTGFLQICNSSPHLLTAYESTPGPPAEETHLSRNYRRDWMTFFTVFSDCLTLTREDTRKQACIRVSSGADDRTSTSLWVRETSVPIPPHHSPLWSRASHSISFGLSWIIWGREEQGSKYPPHWLRAGSHSSECPALWLIYKAPNPQNWPWVFLFL